MLADATYPVERVVDGKIVAEETPALRAINARLLDDYIKDCQGGIDRWNKVVEKAGVAFRFAQPTRASTVDRRVRRQRISPDGAVLTEEQWIKKKCEPNSVGTFLEYLIDYASPETQALGEKVIREEMSHMGDKEADVSERIMRAIRKGKRDVFC